MINEKQIRTLEKATNKILSRVYTNKTYVSIDRLEINRDLDFTIATVRMGIYEEDGQTVKSQIEFEQDLMLDIYSVSQIAALCAMKGLEDF